jgi:CheY-like chemotaxis protein
VADSGIGIPASQIERLFMPFEQADGSTTRQFGGTGLGLAISRRLAEMMGGSLAATSQVGHGSSFILRLPLQETNQTVLRGIRAASSSGKRLAGLRILVAEDNEVNQLVMEDILRREGAAIEIVGNGRLAVDAIDRGELFDAVLMDVQMPVMDGLEATRELGRRLPDLPVIGQTAHALKAEHDKCLAAGMVATIIKPIDIDLLVANVLHHVGSPDHRGALPPPVIEDHSPQELQVIDWDALRQTYPGRPEFIDRMVSIVLHRHQNDAELLRTLVSMLDLKGIHQLAHTLKGLGGNLHAPELSRVAMRAMHAARAESAEALALALELAVAVDRLMEFLGQGKPAPR